MTRTRRLLIATLRLIAIYSCFNFIGATDSASCSTNICDRSQFGLYCPNGSHIYATNVTCNLPYGHQCVIARRNILTLCTGRDACAASGLRRLLGVCNRRNGARTQLIVHYICLHRSMMVASCNGPETIELDLDQAVITSPNFSDTDDAVTHDRCLWSFTVPSWKEAVITVSYLTSRESEGACDEPLVRLQYGLCHGGGVKTKDFCGELTKPERSRACGRVRIWGRGFGRLGVSGTRFLLSFKVDDPENIHKDRILPLKSRACGGQPTRFATTTAGFGVIENEPGERGVLIPLSPTVSPNISDVRTKNTGSAMTDKLLLVIVLVVAGAVIVVLLVSVILVCYKARSRDGYKNDKAEARRRSRESSTSRTGRQSSRHGGSSIEDDIDNDELVVKSNEIFNTSYFERPHSDNFAKYMIKSNGHTRSGDAFHTGANRPRSELTYPSYSSVNDVNTPLPYTTNDSRGSFGEIIDTHPAPNYESLSCYNNSNSGRRSLDDDYDNVEVASDKTDRPINKSPDAMSQNDDVPHYFINGDTYAIVTKSPSENAKTINGKRKSNKLKNPPFLTDNQYKNHIGYIEDGDDVYY